MITINGKTQNYKEMTLRELLADLRLESSVCAVEVNNKLIPHNEKDKYILQDGDTIEIVTLVGGG